MLLLSAANVSLFSQPSVQFKWSEYSKIKKYSQNIFLLNTSNGFVSIVRNANKFNIINYDSSLKIIDKFNFSISKSKETVLGIWYFDNKIYFLTQFDMKNQRIAVKSRVIDISDFNSVDINFPIILIENRFSRNINFRFIEKDLTIEIFHTGIHSSNDENLSLTYYTFSKEMNLLDKAVVELPVKYTLCQIVKAEKTDSAAFFICTKQFYVRPIEKRGLSPNYYFAFYVVNPSKETIDKCFFKNNNSYLDVGRIKYNNGIAEATGFFSETYQGGKQGFWYMKYDFVKLKKEFDTIVYFNQKTKDLPSNGFHKSIFKKSTFESFYVDYLIKDKSDKRIIVAEQFMLIPASFGSAYTYNRFYGDILILYFDKNLNVYNSQRLVKSQQTFNNTGEYSSYYIERKDSALYFFYNDNINSILRKTAYQLIWHKHSCLTLIRAKPDKTEKNILAEYASIGGIIQVRDMLEIGKNKYVLYARKKNKAKIGIMTFVE